MIHDLRILVSLLCVSALFFVSGAFAGDDSIPYNTVPDRVESKAVQLMHELEKQGFEVSRGYFKLWTIKECEYTYEKMKLCYSNNPAAPYVITTLPSWPEESVDLVYSNLWGPSHEGYHDVYRFDPREAIVILGLLPPPGSYFSEQTCLFSRQETPGIGSDAYNAIDGSPLLKPFLPLFFATVPTVPGHPERTQAFSLLSNIVNNVVIERQSGVAFNQIRYFIVTPDQFMDKVVWKAFAGISVKDQDVFTERIPSDMHVGPGPSADDFTTWIRYAHPRDGGRPGTPSDTWRNELPLVVLRVRDTRTTRQPQTYPPVVLEDRSAVDEGSLKPDLESLLFAVSRRWGQPCASADGSDRAGTFADLQTYPTNMVGPSCILNRQNCMLDNGDTSYQLYGRMSLDNGQIYAVAGTLGTETGNATYVGFGINQIPILKGVADLCQDNLLSTAKAYAREVNYTHKF